VEALLPVIGMLLQFSPQEVKLQFLLDVPFLLGIHILVMVSIFIVDIETSHGKLLPLTLHMDTCL
jgi:hypothetical protein